MSDNYVVYHLHSDDSLLDSATKFSDYIDRAAELGMNAIAFTEHGKPLCWVKKKLYCDEKNIKYIHGVEIYLTENLSPKVRDNYHTVLLARNERGVKEINALINLSSDEDHYYYTNRITFDEFLSISDDVIKTSACISSPLSQLSDDHPRYMELANHYDYLEVQPHVCEVQSDYNRRLYELSLKIGKPLIAGTDTHSISQYKAECRDIIMINKGIYYDNEDAFDMTWKTRDEVYDMFARQNALPEEVFAEAIENTNRMAESVEPFDLDKSIKYPILHGSYEQDSQEFVDLVDRRFHEKLNSGIILQSQKEAFERAIAEEMRVFKKLNMCGFMLSMSELVSWCKDNGMAIGTARGSVGGSRIAYITDIIDMNPETWHTVFSRFANEDREEIGDIDIDCVDSDRPAIFNHIVERFGVEHTARVGSFGTNAGLGAIDDIGRALRKIWEKKHPDASSADNPWHLSKIDKIKKDFSSDEDAARKRYPELFYYFDGIVGVKISQSIHPAGMVISPLDLSKEYGVFQKDGEQCLVLDMDELHEVGAAKYDFLILKTVQVIRDTCRLIGTPYPRTHEINWLDKTVWDDMIKSPAAIFQMEGEYAFLSLKKFKPQSIEEMSLVTACIRPSGASYRDALLSRQPHKNPSKLIDDLLSANNGYLVYQCDIIAFLQQVCGLSGSDADTVRRGIARKKTSILEAKLPDILNGYCNKSDKPREEAEKECQEFLRIIEDASSYMFGYNHSIAYCLLGYLCAYYRFYHPVEFITAFLNNAANDEDIKNGTMLAKLLHISIIAPAFGKSGALYTCDAASRTIAKGLSSVKGIGEKLADSLYDVGHNRRFEFFTDALTAMRAQAGLASDQLSTLIHIDFFSEFGNQRELDTIVYLWNLFKQGAAKELNKEKIAGSFVESIVSKYAVGTTKSGKESKNWMLFDVQSILHECEQAVRSRGLSDYGVITKVKNYTDAMGYSGYTSGRDEDRPKLLVKEVFPVKRKKDGKQFGYNLVTQSIGSGVESRMTVFNRLYTADPIKKGDIVLCTSYTKDGQYFTMTGYRKIVTDDDTMEGL